MRVITLFSLAMLLAGCGLFRDKGACKEPKGYQGNAELPLLRVPDGVDAQNQRALLRIPEVKGTATRRPDGRCLDEPPDFVVKPAAQAEAKPQ